MAVFPDKIVQKNSTDSGASVAQQINPTNGSDPIIGGEIVIQRGVGTASIYTLDANNNPVVVGAKGDGVAVSPQVLLNFEEDGNDTPYSYVAGLPLSTDAKFGSQSFFHQAFGSSTPRPNPVNIDNASAPAIGAQTWTLEFWIKGDISDWPPGPAGLQSLIVLSLQDYLYGPGAWTFTLDGGTSDLGGIGTSTSATQDQAQGSIVFGLGGHYGSHNSSDPLIPSTGEVVSSRAKSVIDGDWHHVVFQHEGLGIYSCFVDGSLEQRNIISGPIDHSNPGGSGVQQPSGMVLGGVVVVNDFDPFPGTEYFGMAAKIDGLALYVGLAKYKGLRAFALPTAAPDSTAFLQPADTLRSLIDTDIDLTPGNGDVLSWDSTEEAWTNSPAPSFNISGNVLRDIGDVNVVANNLIQDGEVLSWDSTAQEWVNSAILLSDTDINFSSLGPGWTIRYDGSVWRSEKLDYGDILNAPTALSDLTSDLNLATYNVGELGDVDITTPSQGDVLAYQSATQSWENVAQPPANISSNNLDELSDVQSFSDLGLSGGNSANDNTVVAWDVSNQTWRPYRLDVSDIDNAASKVSDLVKDVGVSYWFNDAGYLQNVSGLSVGNHSDVSLNNPLDSQVLVYRSGQWKNEYGPPANISTNSIGDLVDVTYYRPFSYSAGELTIENLDILHWDSPNQPSNIRFNLHYRQADQALGMEAIRGSDESGSSIHVSRSTGVDMRSDVNFFRLRGKPTVTTNRPQLRFETGDSFASPATGEYIAIEMPANVLESVTYYLPEEDGDVGDVLATNGSGELSWVARVSNNNLGALGDVDLQTQLPVDGSALVYNATAQQWVPGAGQVDLGTSSINELSDVDTSAGPTDGQALLWNATTSEWEPGDVVTQEASPAMVWVISAGDGSDYTFEGPGFPNPTLDPTLYVVRGQKYTFAKTFTGHPFELQEITGVTYSRGVTGSQPITNVGYFEWVVPMDAPSKLKYQCTAHAGMTGIINVLDQSVDLAASSIDDLQDVDTTSQAPSTGQALVWNGGAWVPTDVSDVDLATTSINELQDVDTTSTPSTGQALIWDGANWIPGNVLSQGISGSAISQRASETATSDASGLITFTDLGTSGTMVSVESDVDAWVSIYATAAARTADASRAFDTDPVAGSGVLCEFNLIGGSAVMTSPSTNYFNGNAVAAEEIYALVRQPDGTVINAAQITVTAYAISGYTAISGGTFGSG